MAKYRNVSTQTQSAYNILTSNTDAPLATVTVTPKNKTHAALGMLYDRRRGLKLTEISDTHTTRDGNADNVSAEADDEREDKVP
jgi:murein tripeptide amidase MpaA